jgi:hypothetical protein
MEEQLHKLEMKIDLIDKKLDLLISKMDDKIINNCEKMAEHIDFVNDVYENVKTPLHYISNKINNMLISNSQGETKKSIE